MGVGNLLRTHEDVERVQNLAQQYAGLNLSNGQSVIQELADLKGTLRDRERQFFKTIGKTKEEFATAYKREYHRLENNRTKLYEVERELVENYGQTSPRLSQEQLIQKFNEKINQDFIELQNSSDPNMRKLYDEIQELGSREAAEAISKLVKGTNGKVTFSSVTSRKSSQQKGQGKIGLGRVTISFPKTKKPQDRRFLVKVKEGMSLSPEYAKRIEDYLQLEQEKQADSFDRTGFEQTLIQRLNERGLTYLVSIVQNEGKQIFLNRNESVIKGYFGELYAHAILKRLFGEHAAIPTGTIKKTSSGQSIPIDEVLRFGMEYYNFQIKNYKVNKGQIVINNTLNALTFLRDRLYITGSPLEILTEFFASYQYNQPFEQKERNESLQPGEMSIEEYRSSVYSRFENIFNSFEYLFNKRIGYTLKIQDVFSAASGNLFKTKKEYYNNFFIIQDKIIPASDIIEQIQISLLNSALGTGSGAANYSLLEPTNKAATLQKYLHDPNHEPNLNFLASQARISYHITIQI